MTLSTGASEMRAGLERYTFRVDRAAFTSAVSRPKRIFHEILCGWYLFDPRPNPSDILEVACVAAPDAHVEITMVLKRGHYEFAKLLVEHDDLFVKKDGTVRCSCHPNEVFWISRSSITRYSHYIRGESR